MYPSCNLKKASASLRLHHLQTKDTAGKNVQQQKQDNKSHKNPVPIRMIDDHLYRIPVRWSHQIGYQYRAATAPLVHNRQSGLCTKKKEQVATGGVRPSGLPFLKKLSSQEAISHGRIVNCLIYVSIC